MMNLPTQFSLRLALFIDSNLALIIISKINWFGRFSFSMQLGMDKEMTSGIIEKIHFLVHLLQPIKIIIFYSSLRVFFRSLSLVKCNSL